MLAHVLVVAVAIMEEVALADAMTWKRRGGTGSSPRAQATTMAWCSTCNALGGAVEVAAGVRIVTIAQENFHDDRGPLLNATAIMIGSARGAQVAVPSGTLGTGMIADANTVLDPTYTASPQRFRRHRTWHVLPILVGYAPQAS